LAGVASVNAELRDLLISHQIGLQRLTNREVAHILIILRRTEKDIRGVLRRRLEAGARGTVTTSRLKLMIDEIQELRRAAMSEMYATLATDLEEFAAYEQTYLAKSVRSVSPPAVLSAYDPVLASHALMRSIVRSKPFQGSLLHDHFRALMKRNGAAMRKLRKLIEEGLVEGATPVAITRRVSADALGITRANVQAITQTAMSHVTNTMRDNFAQENTDVVKGVQWVGTLDSKICSICIVRDGHTYSVETHAPLDGGPPWGAGPGRMHYNDRCTSTYVLKSWEEMGIDANELTGQERASMDGFVDADTTALQWAARQGEERLTDLFGATRAKGLLSGTLELSQMWKDWKYLSVDTLTKKGLL